MKKIHHVSFWLLLLLINTACFAQNPEAEGQMTGMRANGKIYVVVAVVVTILLGLFVYLRNLDSKITKLEKDFKQGNNK